MATRLGDMAVGSTVKIKVNGTLTDFLIVHQGNPDSTIYDSSCNGTWVLLKGIYTTSNFGSDNSYKDSNIQSYLSGTFYNLIDSDIRAVIKQVKIPYWYGTGRGGSLATGSNGLSTKVFLLSCYEIGARNGYGVPDDGAELDYFESGDRVAYNSSGVAAAWWLRSPQTSNTYNVWFVNSDGSSNIQNSGNSNGVRPAFVLPSSLAVFNDGAVIGNFVPEVTSDAGATGAELGEKNAPFTVGYTVTDGDGDPMRIVEKVNGVELAIRENVATGTELTVQCLSEKALFQQILNGENTLTLEVDDGRTTTEWTATFTKNVTGAVLSLSQPLTADDTITVAALTLEGSFPADMSLTVEMTNNALDDSPVWENCTDIQRGESRAFVHHAFTNKTAARGFAFNYRITAARGESSVGGTITMIGGVIG